MKVTSKVSSEQVLCYCWLSEFVRCMVDNPLCNVILNKEKKPVNSWNIFILAWKYRIRNRSTLTAARYRNAYPFSSLYNAMFKHTMHACFGGLILLIQTRPKCQCCSWRGKPFVKHTRKVGPNCIMKFSKYCYDMCI